MHQQRAAGLPRCTANGAEAGHPDEPADKPGRRSRPGLPAGSLTLDQPQLAECQAPVRTGALLLTDSAATVSKRAAQLYRSQREDSNLALLVSFLMSASPSGEARPLTGTQESVLYRTGLGGIHMGRQLCEFPQRHAAVFNALVASRAGSFSCATDRRCRGLLDAAAARLCGDGHRTASSFSGTNSRICESSPRPAM